MKGRHPSQSLRGYVFALLYGFPPCEINLLCTKAYDTIVKGFKILEANCEESQKKLAAAQEWLSGVDASHEALTAEMRAAQQILNNYETVRQHVWTRNLY